MNKKKHSPCSADVADAGTGLAGLYMLHRLRAQVFEVSHDVGGIWYPTGDRPNFYPATVHSSANAIAAVTS